MKKVVPSIMLFLFLSHYSPAQSESSNLKKDTSEALVMVNEMPEFPGGLKELYRFIGQNITYPEKAKKKNIQGKCFIRFVVKTDGSVGKVEVQKGVPKCRQCDEEAVNAVKKLPRFEPGKNDGVPVPVWFQLPINFTLK